MQLLLKLIARLGLLLTIVPSFIFYFDGIGLDTVKTIMLVGTVFWLGASPFLQKQHENAG